MEKDKLHEIVVELVRRPGHEKVRTHLYQLLTDGLGAEPAQIDFEAQVPEAHGRIDALLGRTVFEVKRNLKKEQKDAESQLARYLPEREEATGHRYVGIATDGADFQVFALRDGRLDLLGQFRPKSDEPRGLLAWLESVVVLQDELPPEIETFKLELGRESIAYQRALRDIARLWETLADNSEANLKRDLWNRLLSQAYGGDVEAPDLFLQHTYLTVVAKAIATVAFMDQLPPDGAALLQGKQFRDLGIVGAVESDFFDWILLDPQGGDLVMDIARHANRFRLHDITTDILKGLYESLIDPAQRHDLGEYYTPDWLAQRICEAAIKEPLHERVIDPACGSGTFLFHAIRRLIKAATSDHLTPAETVERAVDLVAGIDIHPVAVIFARTTFLLALLPVLREGRPATVAIPVYLGDSLQWNAREFMNVRDLEIVVPAEREAAIPGAGELPEEGEEGRSILRFPAGIAGDPDLFDESLDMMLGLAEGDGSEQALDGWLRRRGLAEGPDANMLKGTYRAITQLREEGRNHIWGYVARNLSRPIWLSDNAQKADVVIGNPPWHSYRGMGRKTKTRFKEEMIRAGLWVGGKSATANDLSAYFFARAAYFYMRPTGRIAFVLPFAAMTREPYKEFRKGRFKERGYVSAQIRFTDAWAFPSDVQPLFPVPACILFGERSSIPVKLPSKVRFYSGRLLRRDADVNEATDRLTESIGPWPTDDDATLMGSAYRKAFRQGATLVPRRLVVVERIESGQLGANPAAPLVRGRTSSQDKEPWRNLPPLEGPIESKFLRPVYLGESIAPFRVLSPLTGIIPYDDEGSLVLNSTAARNRGYTQLARWLEAAEILWEENGKQTMSLSDRWNYNRSLEGQFPIHRLRIVYSKAGTNPASVIIRDKTSIIDHKLYWAAVATENEGRYLAAILNSETTRERAEQWQSMGQWGARDFDKVMFNLPIPRFDSKTKLHKDLVVASKRAEVVANSAKLNEKEHFTRARRRIREALRADGVADEIDKLVSRLLS